MRHSAFESEVTRDDLIAWYRELRQRTERLFRLVHPDAYHDRPIALRNPIVFYEGHLPAFAVNTLLKLALGRPGIDERLERLFERGIDPESEDAVKSPTAVWPSRDEVQAYAREADALIEETLRTAELENDAVPCLRNAEAAFTILEHELMHQETLLYLFHELPHAKKLTPAGQAQRPASQALRGRGDFLQIPPGKATLGAERDRFGWDNELPSCTVDVPEFSINAHNVTNGDWLELMEATGAEAPHFWTRREDEWYWRGFFAPTPLDLDAPVYVTWEQAAAFARWKGTRLPTEAEYHRAAFGTPGGEERQHPWGDASPDPRHGNFDFVHTDPVPAGSYPEGASAWGVHDLVGNGWEWTSTSFGPFPGFEAMPTYPPYSTDFFDDAHFVLKGASPATGSRLIRRSFRNWFRPGYPYVYATFRCAR